MISYIDLIGNNYVVSVILFGFCYFLKIQLRHAFDIYTSTGFPIIVNVFKMAQRSANNTIGIILKLKAPAWYN